MLTKLVNHRLPMREIQSSILGRVKPMTYQIYAKSSLALDISRIGQGLVSPWEGKCDWLRYWVRVLVA